MPTSAAATLASLLDDLAQGGEVAHAPIRRSVRSL